MFLNRQNDSSSLIFQISNLKTFRTPKKLLEYSEEEDISGIKRLVHEINFFYKLYVESDNICDEIVILMDNPFLLVQDEHITRFVFSIFSRFLNCDTKEEILCSISDLMIGFSYFFPDFDYLFFEYNIPELLQDLITYPSPQVQHCVANIFLNISCNRDINQEQVNVLYQLFFEQAFRWAAFHCISDCQVVSLNFLRVMYELIETVSAEDLIRFLDLLLYNIKSEKNDIFDVSCYALFSIINEEIILFININDLWIQMWNRVAHFSELPTQFLKLLITIIQIIKHTLDQRFLDSISFDQLQQSVFSKNIEIQKLSITVYLSLSEISLEFIEVLIQNNLFSVLEYSISQCSYKGFLVTIGIIKNIMLLGNTHIHIEVLNSKLMVPLLSGINNMANELSTTLYIILQNIIENILNLGILSELYPFLNNHDIVECLIDASNCTFTSIVDPAVKILELLKVSS